MQQAFNPPTSFPAPRPPRRLTALWAQVLRMGDDYQRAFASLDEGAAGLSLIQLAQGGLLAELKELLATDADINSVQPGGGTALHAAVKAQRLEAIRTLLEHGADPHVRDAEQLTPLQIAVLDGSLEIYQLLSQAQPLRALSRTLSLSL